MTAAGNIAFGLRMQGKRGDAVRRQVEKMLALVGLEPERLAALAERTGGWWCEADVRDGAAVRRAAAGAAERFGGIDVVVANAGIAAVAPLAEGVGGFIAEFGSAKQ